MRDVVFCMHCRPEIGVHLVIKLELEKENKVRCVSCGFITKKVKVSEDPRLYGLPIDEEYTILCEEPEAKA